MIISTMRIKKNDLLKSIPGDLIKHVPQHIEKKVRLQINCARETACFIYLAKIKGGKHNRGFFLRSQAGDPMAIEEISSEGQVITMPLHNSQSNNTNLSSFHSGSKII
jgi:hypothetical protein